MSSEGVAATIRDARPDDLADILALARSGGLLEAGVAEGLSGFLVAERGGVVGACGIEEHAGDGLLRTVVVEDRYRKAGIGAALVAAALERARARGLRSLFLLTTTAPAYFARLGFAVAPRSSAPDGIRESWEFRAGCPSSAVFMSLEL